MVPFTLIFALMISQLQLPTGMWFFPVTQGQIIRHYRAPESPYGPGHRGVDIATNLAAPVLSPTQGKLVFQGNLGYRNLITIESSAGRLSFEPVCSDFKVGQIFEPGDQIGFICQPDARYIWHCELCLHIGLKTETGYLSPEIYLGGLNPSRLLP